MPLPSPSKLHSNVRINIPRLEDRKIERLLATLAKKIEASQSGSTAKRVA